MKISKIYHIENYYGEGDCNYVNLRCNNIILFKFFEKN
jgi:hypothetical protein